MVHIDRLVIPRGVTAVLGPNGAGKSTLLRSIALVDRATEGEVRVLGLAAHRRRARRSILRWTGYTAQAVSFFAGFTARDTVEYSAWLKAVPQRERVAATLRALDAVGLGDRAASPVRQLSGGMLRRLAVAEAIVHQPALVVLDEPTAGLDPVQRGLLHRSIRAIGASSSVVLSTHLTGDVGATADHVVVLDGGVVAFSGPLHRFQALGGVDADLDAAYAAAVRGPAA